MKIEECGIEDARIITIDKISDDRGFFSRMIDKKQFEEAGLNFDIVQCNTSYSNFKGTMHGLHYQISTYTEEKIIRCTSGKIFDVIIDTRENSKTFKKWSGVELTASNRKTLYVPKGCAHGFVTLDDNTEVFYQNTQVFNHEFERGIKWNDPSFNIKWPIKPTIVSEKDNSWERFKE